MTKVNIEKKTEITIDGRKYSEEDARKIYEALKDHFENKQKKGLKEILDEVDEIEKGHRDKSPYAYPWEQPHISWEPWPDPLRPFPHIWP